MTGTDLVSAIEAGESPAHAALRDLPPSEREQIIDQLLRTAASRRWLRSDPDLDRATADRLLAFTDDFHQQRRDRSLTAVVACASRERVLEHAHSIASGPAAPALWERLAVEPDTLVATALQVIDDGGVAAEVALYHLALDPTNSYDLPESIRIDIASRALSSTPDARGAAAEFLTDSAPAVLLERFDSLILDIDERVRGLTWVTALRLARDDARDIAFTTIANEAQPVEIRRSALIAAGSVLPTADMVDLLTLLVVHPSEELALDAALLLHDYHRHPDIALAAQHSPHAAVRDIAERLMDPFSGSPAAGGSRPGDPTRADPADIFNEMLRQIEQRASDPESDQPSS